MRQWLYFVIFFSLDSLPATAGTQCMFMELMSNSSTYGHCKNVLSSIKYIHTATGNNFPSSNFELEATLQGIKKEIKRDTTICSPNRPNHLEENV